MNTQPYLESKKISRLVFVACFAAYAASYVGRINYSAALPAIIGSGLFTKSQAGIIGSAFFFVYGAFQIINGILGDRLSPFKMVIFGTGVSTLANILMTFCTSNIAMALVWGFNGFALSFLWAAILKILANLINDDMRDKACLNICATLPVGTILAYLLASLSIKFFDWKFVFYIPAIILAVVCVFFTVTYRKAKSHITMRTVEIKNAMPEVKASSSVKLLPLLAAAGIFLLLPADVIHGAIKEGITTWVPTMITEVYETEPSFSVFLSIVLPIFNITGVYIITPIYKKIFKENEIKTAWVILLFALIPLCALIFLKKLPVVLSVALLAIITTAMHTYNYMIITLVPLRFSSQGKTATVTGIMNATAYVGCALASYGFGVISDRIGWTGSIIVWIALDAAAMLVTLIATRGWTRYKNSLNAKEETAAV